MIRWPGSRLDWLLGVAALLVVGLGPGAPGSLGPPLAGAQGPQLAVQITAEPPGLDLTATPASATATVVFYNVQEALVKVDAQGRLVPWLAERWHTTDNLNYTFFLKKGVRFHNGRALTAEDVKFVLDRARNPETKHPHARQYEDITAIHVGDPHTVTITLKRANAMFIYNLARQGSVIYPREAVDQQKSQPVGTGPVRAGALGSRRPHRPQAEPGVPRQGAAEAGARHVPLHSRRERRPGGAPGRGHRRDGLRPRAGVGRGGAARSESPADPGRDDERRDPRAEQLEEALLRRPGPPRDHPRRRQAGGGEGRDVRVRADPGVERRPAQPLLRGHVEGRPPRSGPRQAAPDGGGLPERLRSRPPRPAAVPVHRPDRRGADRAAREGRHPGEARADRVGAVARPRLQERRLRHDDHRARGGLGRRELREPQVLLPIRQPALPGSLP